MSVNDGIEYLRDTKKIYAMIPREEYEILRDSGILTTSFDLWIAIMIKEKLEAEGYINEDGTRTDKVKSRRK